ncbi:MAG TPA: hypothetical protein VK589_24405 [Chryseolinea sp.]|nr:hypothetical protein [Chryseolinea sp.]
MIQQMKLDGASTELTRNYESQFLHNAIRLGWILLIFCSIIQVLFFSSLVNLLCVFAVILGWLVLTKIFLRTSMFSAFPFSAFLITAFVSTQLYFPLIFTTLEGKSLVINLELPEEVFFHSLAGLAVLAVAHVFYRWLSKLSDRRAFPIAARLGFFTPPTNLQLWAMGYIGIGATAYIYFTGSDAGWGVTGTPFDKFVQALMPFSYAPFFIPFGKLYGSEQKQSNRIVIYLLLFAVALFAVSIGRNSRGAFMFGFTSVAFGYILGLLLGVFNSQFITFRNVFFVGILAWLLIGPIADLGTAMVIVRDERRELSGGELLSRTLETYFDKEAIVQRRLEDNNTAPEPDWDERYLDNIFLARFSNIKYNDMSLVQFSKLSEYDPDMLNYSMDFLLSQLPEPVLVAFDIDVDKETVLSVSFGDYIYLLAGGNGYPEGFRTGHFAGTGMATFGWWYLLILGVTMIPVFWLFDKFYMNKKPKIPDQTNGFNGQFSFCGVLYLTHLFLFLPSESVVNIVVFLFRGYIQLVFLYFLIFHLTRAIKGPKKLRWR